MANTMANMTDLINSISHIFSFEIFLLTIITTLLLTTFEICVNKICELKCIQSEFRETFLLKSVRHLISNTDDSNLLKIQSGFVDRSHSTVNRKIYRGKKIFFCQKVKKKKLHCSSMQFSVQQSVAIATYYYYFFHSLVIIFFIYWL